MTDTFELIAVERRATADLLDSLTDVQWASASDCAGWDVRQVVAHLVMPFSLSIPRMVVKLAAKRFDFNRLADEWARNERRSNAELVATLRANAEHRFTPPGLGPEAPLADIVVHTQDIVRPLGIDRRVPDEAAAVILDFLVSPKATRGFLPKGLTDGLALAATDAEWRSGSGAAVAGPGVALIRALTGRRQAFDELRGDGVDVLRSRLR
jgi:uncharacterized protein (TIGR03083 family)